MNFRRIKGTQDILPDKTVIWQRVEQSIRQCMNIYNYREIRTPVFEKTEVFARGIGQLTDIVSKEMYTFLDQGKKSLTLKPEMTAPVIRAYLENNLQTTAAVLKLYYISPLFRQENPQAGRLRQFHQFGAEAIGIKDAYLDVEIILLALSVYESLGIKNLSLKINSVGDPASRSGYKKALKAYFKPNLSSYCKDCNHRYQSNPLRILDCKNKTCRELNKNAPVLLDYLNPESLRIFDNVKNGLKENSITFKVEPYLVRGLDYYTDTVFEITSENLGSQDAICGGGRYDLLAEQFSGPPTPAVGFASGIERLLMVMEAQNLIAEDDRSLDVYLCLLGDNVIIEGMQWLQRLRVANLVTDRDYQNRSLKAQMRDANRQKAKFVLILGENEMAKRCFSVKDMNDGSQTEIDYNNIIAFLQKKIFK